MNRQMRQLFSAYHISNLYHMTHSDNVDNIMKNGLLSHHNRFKKVDISNQEVNDRREKKEPIYGKSIHAYVPFYFNPRNAMMYRNKDEDLVILAFDKALIFGKNTLFTDKNASTNSVSFYHKIEDIKEIDWASVWAKSWCDKPNEVKQSMMAEVLVLDCVSISYLKTIICKSKEMKKNLQKKYPNIEVVVDKNKFFN